MSHYQSTCKGCGRIHRWTEEQARDKTITGWSCTHCGGEVEVVPYELTAHRVKEPEIKPKGMFCLFGALLGRKD